MALRIVPISLRLARSTGPESAVVDGFLGGENPDALGAPYPDAIFSQQRFVIVHALVKKACQNRLDRLFSSSS